MALKLDAAARELAEQITALGVPTSVDPTAAPLPGGWLTVRFIHLNRLSLDAYEVDFVLYLIAGDYDTPEVLDKLSGLLELVAPYASGDVEAITLAMPNYGPTGLPALAVTIPVDVYPDVDTTSQE